MDMYTYDSEVNLEALIGQYFSIKTNVGIKSLSSLTLTNYILSESFRSVEWKLLQNCNQIRIERQTAFNGRLARKLRQTF